MVNLSIIVPVFNVEKYIACCLESLLCQELSYNEYEVLVIIDGSIDKSEYIARQYAQKYSHIKVFKQQNQGLGGARNTGIKNASGKYIQFVDSDDFLEPNVIKPLLLKMENEKLDVLRFNYQNVKENLEKIQPNKLQKKADYQHEICDGLTFLNEHFGFTCYACQFIINSELLKSEGCFFKNNVFFEDTEWTPRILVNAKRVSSINLVVYNCLLRQGSITKSISIDKKRKWVNDKIYVIHCLIYQRSLQERKDWYNGMIAHTVVSIITYVALNFYSERNYYIKRLKQENVFPLTFKNFNVKFRLRVIMINTYPLFYCWFIHAKNL